VAVIVARNEEGVIKSTIKSLKHQSHKIWKIVVVDDGSTDETPRIATEMGSILIALPYHSESLIGNPQLALRWNLGFEQAELFEPDYILIIGADHILPENYVEELLTRMDNNVVIASGRLEGEIHKETMPRGSGRLIDVNFWKNAGGLRFPIIYGWESYIVYKALSLGFETRAFPDIVSKTRSVSRGMLKAECYGRAMKELGYCTSHAFARSLLLSLKNPKEGLIMAYSFILHSRREHLDIAKYVNEYQRKHLVREIINFIKKGRR
jgi:glycosyltransferase involved in cell wall biosynthesis